MWTSSLPAYNRSFHWHRQAEGAAVRQAFHQCVPAGTGIEQIQSGWQSRLVLWVLQFRQLSAALSEKQLRAGLASWLPGASVAFERFAMRPFR